MVGVPLGLGMELVKGEFCEKEGNDMAKFGTRVNFLGCMIFRFF